jgi:BirA family biotin operon repressor/biotin-[acetyl-CoA-carboxylase] ligase
VAGLATRAAVADFDVAAQLKWPNDLLIDGAKLSGVLLEAWNVGPHYAVAVGIGVNLAEHPLDLPYRAAHLAEIAGRPVPVREFIERLAVRFDEALALFARGLGFAEVRARWLEGAAGLGRPMRATTAAGVREGLFEGLDARGRLLLRVQDAIETVESADIALLQETHGGESLS